VRVLEALKILEDATRECKDRPINTPQVNEALDVIERYVDTDWRVKSFRHNLDGYPNPLGLGGDAGEGQQQELRVSFGGIYRCVRGALANQIGTLGRIYLRSNKDPAIKAEIDRLNVELETMPERWEFRSG